MNKRGWINLSVNLGLITLLSALAWIYGPTVIVEAKYQEQVNIQKEVRVPTNSAVAVSKPSKGFASFLGSTTGFDSLLDMEVLKKEPKEIQPVSGLFGLVIPKIFVNVTVTEGVNPAEKAVYQSVLEQAGGVAHAAGSAVPGEEGTVYIFGHSTDVSFNVARFNAVFYLLKKLEPGDEIIAYYYYVPYHYQVVEKKTVEPDDISDITNVDNKQRLVLQTCWPPGTDWKRLLIVAEPIIAD